MGFLKKTEKTEPVTHQAFVALSAQLESFKAITALAIAAVKAASQGGPGLPSANPRTRFEKLAAAADLEPAESAELKSFLKRLDALERVESRRAMEEEQWKSRPRRGEDIRPLNWSGK